MVTAKDPVQVTVDALTELTLRSRRGLSERLRRVRANLLLIAQAGLASGLSWFAAERLVGHGNPFFAPIAAVIVLNVSVGQRMRRAVELVLGVALGILVGDVLIYFVGTGGWQIGTGVALVIAVTVFLGGGPVVIGQAAASAVLVATLAPPTRGIYYSRFLDALVGGAVGVLVMAILLPVNPLTVIQRSVDPALRALEQGLRDCAAALANADPAAAVAASAVLRESETKMAVLRENLVGVAQTATLVPVRWRSRAPLAQYVDAAAYIDRALRNSRVLARRTVALLEDGEPSGPLAPAVAGLADAVGALRPELAAGVEPTRTRRFVVEAISAAGDAYRSGLGFSGTVVVAQVRSAGKDLLCATGVGDRDADRVVRRAGGRLPMR